MEYIQRHFVAFRLMILFLPLGLSHCAHSIHEYQSSDFRGTIPELKSAKVISSSTTRKYIIAKFDQDFVEQAYDDLLNKCPKGRITGITTKYVTDLSFFSFTERLEFEGLCIAAATAASIDVNKPASDLPAQPKAGGKPAPRSTTAKTSTPAAHGAKTTTKPPTAKVQKCKNGKHKCH